MFETIIVFVLGLTPPLLSIWVMHRAKEQAQIRLRNSIQASTTARVLPRNPLPPDQYYLEGVGYLIRQVLVITVATTNPGNFRSLFLSKVSGSQLSDVLNFT